MTSPLAPVLASALASVATLLGIVPRVVRRRLLRAAGATAGMDRVHEDVTVETMCGFGNVVTMLGLARDEMRSLQSPFDGPYPAGLVLFDDPPDVWCAAKGPLVDRARGAGSLIRVATDTPHAARRAPTPRPFAGAGRRARDGAPVGDRRSRQSSTAAAARARRRRRAAPPPTHD